MDIKALSAKIDNFGKNELIYWSNAIAGEAGELCNLVKKHYRDGDYQYEAMKEEIADIFIYIAITARDILKFDLEAAVLSKIEKVKQRRKVGEK